MSLVDLDYMAEKANELDMVQWDRSVLHQEDAAMYGWIPGDQPGRFDFVILMFWFWDSQPGYTYATSSARYSAEIHQIVCPETPHEDCQPVQGIFGDALNRMVARELSTVSA